MWSSFYKIRRIRETGRKLQGPFDGIRGHPVTQFEVCGGRDEHKEIARTGSANPDRVV